MSMFNPDRILTKNIIWTKLTSLPIQSFLGLAEIIRSMNIYFAYVEGQSTFVALSEWTWVFTFFKQMCSEITKVNYTITFLTMSKEFALSQIVSFLIFCGFITLAAVCANIVFLGLFLYFTFKNSYLAVLKFVEITLLKRWLIDWLTTVRQLKVTIITFLSAVFWLL